MKIGKHDIGRGYWYWWYSLSHVVGPAEFTSFEELQANETQQLLLSSLAVGDDNPSVLLGDFNHGPSIPDEGIVQQYEANYKIVIDAGFTSPFLNEVALCTFCRENTLVNSTTSTSKIIDHVYVRKGAVVSDAKVSSRLISSSIDTSTCRPFLSVFKVVSSSTCPLRRYLYFGLLSQPSVCFLTVFVHFPAISHPHRFPN